MPAIASSSTSSRTSRISSTSDDGTAAADSSEPAPQYAGARRALLAVRLVHPFPSTLDAVATAAIALLAGATPGIAVRLALGMLGIQFGIGAANDVADVEADATSRADKPIPAGIVSRSGGAAVAAACVGVGLIAAASVGPEALLLAGLGLAIGLAYDARLKGTEWAWLAFALGVGLLPVYALWGATGCTEPAYGVIFVLAVAGGASLALANALADLATDETAGLASVATSLGWRATLLADAALLAVVEIVAIGSTAWVGAVPVVVLLAFAIGAGISWAGIAASAARLVRAPRAGWEIQAIGLVVTGVAWLAALQAGSVLRSC